MANIAIAPTPFVAGTVTADVITAAAEIKSVVAGNVAVISAGGDASNLTISIYNASGGATATLKAGDSPPSLLSGQGDGDAQTIGAGTVKLLTVPGGRYVQDDGTIHVAIATNTCIVGAFRASLLQ